MGTFLPLPLASCSSAFFPEMQLNQHSWSMQAASWGKEEIPAAPSRSVELGGGRSDAANTAAGRGVSLSHLSLAPRPRPALRLQPAPLF